MKDGEPRTDGGESTLLFELGVVAESSLLSVAEVLVDVVLGGDTSDVGIAEGKGREVQKTDDQNRYKQAHEFGITTPFWT